ncbi:hypothetical protein HELRODRAFT_192851 [Helobdella robusta]|uniref:Uncharacterized protein n=1 Tax=Helobdella robusta TaxID=6412 RepID=T1FUC9_HELRO|nr:hypothetical protein HELRODRAFT_192851 [Helobdella robusta]ESN99541.1 hypothetical protein HELRODRAFT_192851 [Helobdella robusta]
MCTHASLQTLTLKFKTAVSDDMAYLNNSSAHTLITTTINYIHPFRQLHQLEQHQNGSTFYVVEKSQGQLNQKDCNTHQNINYSSPNNNNNDKMDNQHHDQQPGQDQQQKFIQPQQHAAASSDKLSPAVHNISFMGLTGAIFASITFGLFFYWQAFVTASWVVQTNDAQNSTLYTGLWHVYQSYAVSNNEGWFLASQILFSSGLVGFVLSFILAVIYMSANKASKNLTLTGLVITAFCTSAILLLGLIILGTSLPSGKSLSWSYAVAVVGMVLLFIGGVLANTKFHLEYFNIFIKKPKKSFFRKFVYRIIKQLTNKDINKKFSTGNIVLKGIRRDDTIFLKWCLMTRNVCEHSAW